MDSLKDDTSQKREALAKSALEGKKNEAVHLEEYDGTDTQTELKWRVHDSIHSLVRIGYDFQMILKGSKVDRSFLEQAFEELRYCKQKQDLDIITSDEENDGKFVSLEGGKRVQVEIKLFMMRVQLEINKLSVFLDHVDVQEQLRDGCIKEQLEEKRELLIKSMNELFDKVTKKGEETGIQRKRKNANSKDPRPLKHSKGLSSPEPDDSSPNVLIDSGLVKISESQAEDFKPYHSVISYNKGG